MQAMRRTLCLPLGLLMLGRGSGRDLLAESHHQVDEANLCWGKLSPQAKLVLEPRCHQNYEVTAAGNLQIRILDQYVRQCHWVSGGAWAGTRTITDHL
jgi:hypothetical protein